MTEKDEVKQVSEKARVISIKGLIEQNPISLSFKEYLGIKDSILPKLASGLVEGLGGKGSLCGAFTGSIMAIG